MLRMSDSERLDAAFFSGGEAQGSHTAPPARHRPHICFVAPQVWPVIADDSGVAVVGGAEVQQCILARLFAEAGYPVTMICFDYGQPHRVVRDGITFVSTHRLEAGIPVLRFIHPRITEMWRTLREVDADIYYQRSSGVHTALVAAFCRYHKRRSIYAGACDYDFVPGKQMIRLARDRWIFERGLAAVDAVVVQNEGQQQNCLRHYGRNSTLIPSCYVPPANSRQGGGDEFILWVGMMRPSKRPDLFVELARRLPDRRFVMVGGAAAPDDGGAALYNETEAAARTVPNLEFAGFRPLQEVEPLFDRAAVVVNTSDFEGMPNVFMQAWARGIPTVAFVDTGSRLDGRPIYPIATDPGHAVAEIERLCADATYRAEVGNACRTYFEQAHGRGGVLARYAALFDELAGATR